jgi:hypothetical protein
MPRIKRRMPNLMVQISSLLRADPNLDKESAEAVKAIVRAAYERMRKAKD